jgi:hypothetical protein
MANEYAYVIPVAPAIIGNLSVQRGYMVLRFPHEAFPIVPSEPATILAYQRLSMNDLLHYASMTNPTAFNNFPPVIDPTTASLTPTSPLPTFPQLSPTEGSDADMCVTPVPHHPASQVLRTWAEEQALQDEANLQAIFNFEDKVAFSRNTKEAGESPPHSPIDLSEFLIFN